MTAIAEAQNRNQVWEARPQPAPPRRERPGNPVVVATDGSAASLHAVDWAAAEARRRTAALRIVAVPSLPPLTSRQRVILDPPVAVADAVWSDFKQFLEIAAARAAAQHPCLSVAVSLMLGQPGEALAEGVQDACMLVLGAPGAGAAEARSLGSVSDYVAGHALLPVVIVRGTPAAAHGEIVAAVHGAGQLPALAFAAALAASRRARLRVLDVDRGEPQLAALLAGWQLSYPGLAVTQETVFGAAGSALVRASAHADLVVTGQGTRRGRGAGIVVYELLRHAHCPVAVIPADGQAG